MSIIKETDLNFLIKNKGLTPLHAVSNYTKIEILLQNSDVEKFLEFVESNKIKYVFYAFEYYSIDDYVIPRDWYDEQTPDCIKAVESHNIYVESFDFKVPNRLELFFIMDGVKIGLEQENMWLEKVNVLEAESMIELIEARIYTKSEDTNVMRKIKIDELRKEIIDDPEFRFCKNQNLRYWYMVELLEKEDYARYRQIFEPIGAPHVGNIKNFMDKTWALYKERTKNSKN